MLKKYLVVGMSILVLNVSFSSVAFAESKEDKERKHTEKVKESVIKLGQGPEARVTVKLKNGTKVKGYISQIDGSKFFVVDDATGAATEIPYPQTKQVKGNNLSTGVKVAIGVGIVLGILFIIGLAQ